MSQELTPIATTDGVIGLSPQLTTAVFNSKPQYLSPQYKKAKELKVSPTQWVPGGRPIYRRLPASSEQYQLDFFADGGIGYALIPAGGDQFGAGSLYVNQSENLETLLIESGVIVWEEGTNSVYKTFLNFREVGVEDGRYLVCFQLLYDDLPEPLPFQVTDYSLAGLDFNVIDSGSFAFNASSDTANPWPNPGSYLFMPSTSELDWRNYLDTVNRVPGAQAGVKPGIPEYDQPLLAYVEWESQLPWQLNTIKIRTKLTYNIPPCSLYLSSDEGASDPWFIVQTTEAQEDANGFYWEFQTSYVAQTKWKLEWPNESKVNAYGLTVSGVLFIETRPSTARARTQLALYPTNLVPKDVSLCRLAIISVDNFKIARKPTGELFKDDTRSIVTQDYEPLANWLTEYWDERLINIWEKTKTFTPGFMAPPTLLKTSYYDLEVKGIDVKDGPPDVPPPPPIPTEVNLVGASVSFQPLSLPASSLTGAVVSFSTDPAAPLITGITIGVTP